MLRSMVLVAGTLSVAIAVWYLIWSRKQKRGISWPGISGIVLGVIIIAFGFALP